MDAIDLVVDPLIEFSKDSIRLVKRCRNLDHKEFVMMGFVGFFMKLIFIPINNIIVGRGGATARPAMALAPHLIINLL
ncbi:unnamed protein product [Prunus armeniaca]|uniref:Uncharacterized protein n=1 Tax=Prunus armeniaca TaxID=36596 RepID=A0A6J5V853_PRUAR|nr:unnamed protein product [Prunus armeniaca]